VVSAAVTAAASRRVPLVKMASLRTLGNYGRVGVCPTQGE